MIVLGIESSCDETGVALVRDGTEILSNVVYSQVTEHAPFRGVVPEIASRAHLEKINWVYETAISQSGGSGAFDVIAVTVRPGLMGSLMMGGQFAKTLSIVDAAPIIGVNHLEAHFYALCLETGPHEYPFLGLLLSGGNSAIYRVDGPGRLVVLADTLDDACGEAFDKVAVLLGLAYPGGPAVEAKAAEYSTPAGVKSLFPRLLRELKADDPVFSFSGIKTAVLRTDRSAGKIPQICYDFQETVFELVLRVLSLVVQKTGITRIACAGGVLANGLLKKKLETLGAARGWDVRLPSRKILCTDNAAMVASLGYFLAVNGLGKVSLDFHVSSDAGWSSPLADPIRED